MLCSRLLWTALHSDLFENFRKLKISHQVAHSTSSDACWRQSARGAKGLAQKFDVLVVTSKHGHLMLGTPPTQCQEPLRDPARSVCNAVHSQREQAGGALDHCCMRCVLWGLEIRSRTRNQTARRGASPCPAMRAARARPAPPRPALLLLLLLPLLLAAAHRAFAASAPPPGLRAQRPRGARTRPPLAGSEAPKGQRAYGAAAWADGPVAGAAKEPLALSDDAIERQVRCGGQRRTWGTLAQGEGGAGKRPLALLALLGTKLAHSARVRTIKHRLERWSPLECRRRAAAAAAKESSGEWRRTT